MTLLLEKLEELERELAEVREIGLKIQHGEPVSEEKDEPREE